MEQRSKKPDQFFILVDVSYYPITRSLQLYENFDEAIFDLAEKSYLNQYNIYFLLEHSTQMTYYTLECHAKQYYIAHFLPNQIHKKSKKRIKYTTRKQIIHDNDLRQYPKIHQFLHTINRMMKKSRRELIHDYTEAIQYEDPLPKPIINFLACFRSKRKLIKEIYLRYHSSN